LLLILTAVFRHQQDDRLTAPEQTPVENGSLCSFPPTFLKGSSVMSQSVEARLFFGFSIDMDSLSPAVRAVLEERSYNKAYALSKGLVEPPYTVESMPQWRAWHEQVEALMKGLQIDRYYADSDGEEEIQYVTAKTYSIWRDGAEALNSKDLWVRKALTAKLKDFCDTLGIPWQTPQWQLVCYRDH
jgi:hypothetical protein